MASPKGTPSSPCCSGGPTGMLPAVCTGRQNPDRAAPTHQNTEQPANRQPVTAASARGGCAVIKVRRPHPPEQLQADVLGSRQRGAATPQPHRAESRRRTSTPSPTGGGWVARLGMLSTPRCWSTAVPLWGRARRHIPPESERKRLKKRERYPPYPPYPLKCRSEDRRVSVDHGSYIPAIPAEIPAGRVCAPQSPPSFPRYPP